LKKNPSQKRTDGVALGRGPEFKPQYRKKKKKKKKEKEEEEEIRPAGKSTREEFV
jgi:hypothetical protein